MNRRRLHYLVIAIAVIALGLASRAYREGLPVFLAEYAGDTLWGCTVYLLFSVTCPRAAISHRAGAAIVFAFAIEFGQLYHASWIDAIRATTIGGLILGFDFVWSDLACYSAGILIGAVGDRLGCNSRSN